MQGVLDKYIGAILVRDNFSCMKGKRTLDMNFLER